MMQDESWETRIRYMLDDFLYKGALPPPVLAGVTVLLPKTVAPPQAWGNTRPITLSSAILKWFAQLLLVRGGHQLQDGDIYQWAKLLTLFGKNPWATSLRAEWGDYFQAGGQVRGDGKPEPGWGCWKQESSSYPWGPTPGGLHG